MPNPWFTEMQIVLQKQYVNKSFVSNRQETKLYIKYRTNTSSSFQRIYRLKVDLSSKEMQARKLYEQNTSHSELVHQ